MKSSFALLVCSLLLANNAQALLTAEQIMKEKLEKSSAQIKNAALEAEEKALPDCNVNRYSFTFPSYDLWEQREAMKDATITIDWSGGCLAGKRNGQGILSWETDTSWKKLWRTEVRGYERESYSVQGILSKYRAEGRFVNGLRVGLWCGTTEHSEHNLNRHKLEEGCVVLAGHGKPLTGLYRKQPDGSWQEYADGRETDSTAAEGSLEALSEKVIADALAGKTDLKGSLVVKSKSLNDLVRGSKIVSELSPAPISLRGKRIAVVLSTNTIRELERFKLAREELINASVQFANDPYRRKFIDSSNPELMLVGISKALRLHASSVQASDDLLDLKRGKVDYAFILDWKDATEFGRLADYYRSPRDLDEAIVAEQSLSGFLVNRELKAIKKFSTKDSHSESKNWYTKNGDMRFLVEFFVSIWGDEGLNNFNSQLDAFFKE